MWARISAAVFMSVALLSVLFVLGSSCHAQYKDLTMNALLQRIAIDPEICGGKPCIRGTRIWVSLILDFLADGMSEQEILTEYPQLTHEDVLAAIAYAAEIARERTVVAPVNQVA
jgi:uncharacterized protein (DUF433 family)